MDNLPWLTRYTCGKEIHIMIIYDLVYEYNVDVCIDHLKFLICDQISYIQKPCIIMFSYAVDIYVALVAIKKSTLRLYMI